MSLKELSEKNNSRLERELVRGLKISREIQKELDDNFNSDFKMEL